MTNARAINHLTPMRPAPAFASGQHKSPAGNKAFLRSGSAASKDGWPQQPNYNQGWQESSDYGNSYGPSAYAGLSPALFNLWNQNPNLRSNVEIAGTAIDFLGQHGINARLGGSLAGSAYGATRDPKDLDMYVSTPAAFEYGYRLLSQLSTIGTMPDGQQVLVQGAPGKYYKPGKLGQLELMMTYQNGQRNIVGMDLVNENAPGLGAGLFSPSQRGTPQTAGNVEPANLIVGFLRRHTMQPELSAKKDDVYQIAAILRAAGIDPGSSVAYHELVDAMGQQFTPETRPLAEYKMREILNWMRNGQL